MRIRSPNESILANWHLERRLLGLYDIVLKARAADVYSGARVLREANKPGRLPGRWPPAMTEARQRSGDAAPIGIGHALERLCICICHYDGQQDNLRCAKWIVDGLLGAARFEAENRALLGQCTVTRTTWQHFA